jgi:hypothetical protein
LVRFAEKLPDQQMKDHKHLCLVYSFGAGVESYRGDDINTRVRKALPHLGNRNQER